MNGYDISGVRLAKPSLAGARRPRQQIEAVFRIALDSISGLALPKFIDEILQPNCYYFRRCIVVRVRKNEAAVMN